MFEKVNPAHPDKVADRIAGAIVDLAYLREETPKVAVEVLIGHGECTTIIETSTEFNSEDIENIVHRIAGVDVTCNTIIVPQDKHLADNQKDTIRCGDNGIFKGVPRVDEENLLVAIAWALYDKFHTDGKYVIDSDEITICQSNASYDEIEHILDNYTHTKKKINPLGVWTGGINTDSGATNRKLGSDMGEGITGGGLHGKDLSKADVSANIYAYLRAQEIGSTVELSCSIGDEQMREYHDGKFTGYIPYSDVVDKASQYIKSAGGFEKFAEWGLI